MERFIMKSVVVGFLHRKNDKRVLNTVKLLTRLGEVDYLYWSEGADIPIVMDGVNFIPFFHRLQQNPIRMWNDRKIYERNIMKFLVNSDADLYYLHHFATTRPLAAYRVLSKKNALIVTDFHEYVPEQYLEGVSIPRSLKTRYANHLYNTMLRKTDGAVFVSRKMLEMASSVNSSLRSIFVPNYALGLRIPVSRASRRKEIVFVGKTTRKINREIEILRLIMECGFTFTSLGSESNFGDLKANVMEALPYDQMMDYISESAFTIISYDVFDNKGNPWLNMVYSMPNKFFDSLGAGTPVIVASDFEEMARIIQKNKIGILIDRNEMKRSVDRIVSLWNSADYDRLLDSIRSTQDEYAWDTDKEESFLSYIRTLTESIK